MQLNQIDLNLFVVFNAIYEQRNLTRASEVLCMTQPAVSNALARLRQSLDDKLFVRAAGGVAPTPMADNIIGNVREALKLLETSVSEGTVFNPQQSSKVFRLSMGDLAESMLLPSLLNTIQQQAPKIGIECYYVGREDIERELAAGTVDLALDVPLLAGPQTCRQPLLNERYVCMVRHNHPTVGDSISLDNYLQLDHIQVSSRRKGLGYEDIALQRLGRQRNIRVRIPHFHVAPMLLDNSDMVLTLPYNLAKQYSHKIVELPFALPPLNWQLYWHKSADQDQANQWLRTVIMNII